MPVWSAAVHIIMYFQMIWNLFLKQMIKNAVDACVCQNLNNKKPFRFFNNKHSLSWCYLSVWWMILLSGCFNKGFPDKMHVIFPTDNAKVYRKDRGSCATCVCLENIPVCFSVVKQNRLTIFHSILTAKQLTVKYTFTHIS